MSARDFSGYRWNYPQLRWPGDTGLAVSFVLNVEEGAEFALSAGDLRNESHHEVKHEVVGAPDLCMESQFEYGARVGYWRITRALMEAGIPLTLNACARALETTPWIATDAAEQGFEVCCHGWRWESHAGMAEEEERALIARCVESIRRLHGRAPVGWHTKSSASVNTRRLLVEQGGFLYDSDAYNDDLPYYVRVAGRPHLVLPYAFDTNDMRFFDSYAYVRGSDFADYAIDAFDALLAESRATPRMLSIGLHTRIIGRPGRIEGLRQLTRHIAQRGGAWCATREQIARHWLAHMPPEAA
ncbi:polysaccharide deacetylase [Pseudorhodoferax aquiterrae]|uniref:Polysaccharide deacetylase n=1 Tax=Pseudorhodoferax aquiterrae TaxID=747304 RepID=A0ABQ3FVK4_9BURK|nr:polysaccharide deacetylase family protein [Pseudorhodoferax aquiterrae]GHC69776.1 polysaccharide deacetylase [Pseudorhodoferax aquiterrae]